MEVCQIASVEAKSADGNWQSDPGVSGAAERARGIEQARKRL